MRDFELALKAAADPTRTRILKILEGRSLCVCQVQAVLGLAPSTVSKHLTILKIAGLVVDRRDGKWIEYALADAGRNPFARPVIDMLRGLNRDPAVAADRRRRREVLAVPVEKICALPPMKSRASRPVRPRRGGAHA